MDKIDLQIIEALQENGRVTNLGLSKKLGIGEATVRRRIKNLISEGIIKSSVIPNPLKVGFNYVAIMGLQVQLSHLDDVANKLSQNERVCFLTLASGQFDIMLIALLSSPEDLANFIRKNISPDLSILRTETFMSMDVIKSFWTDSLDLISLLANLEQTRQNNKKDRR